MIEIWRKYARFKTTSPKLADQVRIIIKKGWFSNLGILEIHQQQQQKNQVKKTLIQ